MEIGGFFGLIILAAQVWAVDKISHSGITTAKKWMARRRVSLSSGRLFWSG